MSYYYATPIGQGMSNLANAIGSIPLKQEQLGLLQQRQRLIDAQIAAEEAQRGNYGASARAHNAKAQIDELTATGRTGLSKVFEPLPLPPAGQPGTTGIGSGSVGETQTVPDYGILPAPPTRVDPGAGSALPGAGSTLASSVTSPSVTIGGKGFTAPGLAVMPTPAAKPNTTGITIDMAHKIAQFASLTGMDPEKLVRMFAGTRAGAIENAPDLASALSYIGYGAGEEFQNTLLGTRESLTQKDVGNQRDVTAKYFDTTVDAATGIERERMQQAGATTREGMKATAKEGKPGKLTDGQLKIAEGRIQDVAAEKGFSITPSQVAQVVAKVGQRVGDGQEFASALVDEMDNMVGSKPGDPSLWNRLTFTDPKEVPAFKPPALGLPSAKARKGDANNAQTSAKPAAAAPAAKGGTINKLPTGAKQVGTSGGKPVYETPDGKRFIQK